MSESNISAFSDDEAEPAPDADYPAGTGGESPLGDVDLDQPADVETDNNPTRDADTGEPLPADPPADLDG